METEVWPNLFSACRRAGVPVALVNARLSERSARGYRRIGGLAREALQNLSLVAAQTRDDAARLTALGARRVEITGNIKFDATPPGALLELGEAFRSRAAGRRILLAASTREGAAALLLDADPARNPGLAGRFHGRDVRLLPGRGCGPHRRMLAALRRPDRK